MTVDKIPGYNNLNNAQKGVVGGLHAIYAQGKIPTDNDFKGIDISGVLVAQESFQSQILKFGRAIDRNEALGHYGVIIDEIAKNPSAPYIGGAIKN